MLNRIRPQVLAAILVLGILGALGVLSNYNEAIVGAIAGIVGLGNSLLEKE